MCGLFYMQIIRGDTYHRLSMNNRIRLVASNAPRGRILDRHGMVVADNQMSFNVGIIPGDIEDKKILFDYLAAALHKDSFLLERQFQRRKASRFFPVIVAEDVPRELAIKIEEEKFIYPGLVVVRGFQRVYPFKEAGAHVLGYVGKNDNQDDTDDHGDRSLYGYRTPPTIVGKTGLEKRYEFLLQGERGGHQIEIDSLGAQVRFLGIKEPVSGEDLVLTIDQRLQMAAQQLLEGLRGSIVVMDLDHADVFSMVSSPSYDPNIFLDKKKQDKIGVYFNDRAAPLLNRAISGRYPPGSVFKILLALAALQNHLIVPTTSFDCPGYMMVGKRRFGCSHVHGTQDLKQALAHSCNVYFFNVGERLGASMISAYARVFGLNRPTGVDLPFEAKGTLVTRASEGRPWYKGDTLNLSIGQGYTLTTPLELTVLMAAVANDGVVLFPRLVQTNPSKRAVIRLRDDVWHKVQEGLKAVVDDEQGTGHDLKDIRGMDIYGKTGTAQSGTGKPNHAWFVGYAKSSINKIAFCVFLEYGGASENAVLLAKNLLLKLQSLKII